MGCSSSMYMGQRVRVKRRLEKTVVQIGGESEMDWDAPCNRTVKEFPMYAERLKDIDYQGIIDSGIDDWKDENFPTT